MFHSPPQLMWDLNIHPLRGPASSLALVPFCNRYGTLLPPKSILFWGPTSLHAHRLVSTPFRGSASSLEHCPVSSSDTICNGSSSPLPYIIIFGISLSDFPRERFSHLYKECFVLLFTYPYEEYFFLLCNRCNIT